MPRTARRKPIRAHGTGLDARIESFNGRLREECLNTNVFTSLEEARRKLLEWKIDHNEQRPHGPLGDLTPTEFAERHQGKQAA